MTGNTLTQNPLTSTNAYANNAYGTPQQGFWGNTAGFGINTPFGMTNPSLQTQVPNLFNQYGTFTPQGIQQPGLFGQPTNQWQTGFTPFQQAGFQGIQNPMQQAAPQQVLQQVQQQATQQILQQILQTTPPQVLNTILQTTPPQVLPYVLNALACQQVCQQVLSQNPQAAVQAINPQAITQPFTGITQPMQGQFGTAGFGMQPTQFTGYQPQFGQGACVGCVPGTQQWGQTLGFQGGFGQFQPQQPWFATTYGTW